MRKEIQKVKELTSKPFGINIFHSGQNPDVQLEREWILNRPRRVPGKNEGTYLAIILLIF